MSRVGKLELRRLLLMLMVCKLKSVSLLTGNEFKVLVLVRVEGVGVEETVKISQEYYVHQFNST